jgi:H+/Cl- antiporter ClcA
MTTLVLAAVYFATGIILGVTAYSFSMIINTNYRSAIPQDYIQSLMLAAVVTLLWLPIGLLLGGIMVCSWCIEKWNDRRNPW